MQGNQSGQLPSIAAPGTRGSSLRQRIVSESISAAKDQRRRQAKVFFRAPDFPGTALFDLNNDLQQVPYAKRKRSTPVQPETTPFFSEDDLLTMSNSEYHDMIMQELDSIEEASRSNSPEPDTLDLPEEIVSASVVQEPDNTVESALYGEHFFPSQEGVFEPSLTALPPSRPVTERQLIAEVKGIYTGLIELENGYLGVVERQARSPSRLTDQEWNSVVALHKTLLQDHHDFFAATQHPRASSALKSLASNYAMPSHMWRQSMYTFLELIRHRSPRPKQSLQVFGNLLAQTMQRFAQNIPHLSHEWDLIQDNLREYFSALRVDGVDVPSSLADCWKNEETFWTRFRKTLFPPMQGHFFGDYDLPEWLTRAYLPDSSWWSSQNPLHDDSFGKDGVLGTAQLIMTGWLSYGRKIATSYHAYCQVFIFLAVVVFAASQMKD